MEQLHWSYAGGGLRDGDSSTFPPHWTTLVSCGVLDRLPVFRYRYKNLEKIPKPIPSNQKTTEKLHFSSKNSCFFETDRKSLKPSETI